MWLPESASQIDAAARAGTIEESATFDAKAGLPAAKKNADLATDVAAMSTDGGVLLYGVAEDESKRPTRPQPIALAGAEERISNVISTSISEVPDIEITALRLTDDPAKGYLVVHVPQSARAPHQVLGTGRFYGREGTTNRQLTESEIARLYQRRADWERDRETILAQIIAHAPLPAAPDDGYLHGFVWPAVPDQEMYERAAEAHGGRDALQQTLQQSIRRTTLAQEYGPTLAASTWQRLGGDAWRLTTRTDDRNVKNARYLADLDMNIDGRGQLFCGRAADGLSRGDESSVVILEIVIAGSVEAFIAAMSTFYRAAGYHGPVDVGVAVTGIEGAGSLYGSQHLMGGSTAYRAKNFTRTKRLSASELEEPAEIARRLLHNLFDATTGMEHYDPFDPQYRRG